MMSIRNLIPDSAMYVVTYRVGQLVYIDADVKPHLTGVELSDVACQRLWNFFEAYYQVHSRDLEHKCVDHPVVGWEGLHVRVLPRHRREMASRIAVFIADPANHDRVGCEESSVLVGWNGSQDTTTRKWTPEDAGRNLEKTRRMVEATWPGLLNDPLGEISGAIGPG